MKGNNNTNKPFVSVIMAVFNGKDYLKESINSILNQTHSNFEFIIVNDGSTDNSLDIILSFDDPRIQVVNQKNAKLPRALNNGIAISNGKYIVRMDADDISFPTRIEEQVLFMESNPKVVALGTWARMIGNGKVRTLRKAREHAEIERLFLFVSPIIHPSSIIRKDVLKKYNIKYREEYEVSQDLQLWYELMKIGELANLQKCLLEYRLENNNSVNQKEKVKKYSNQIRRSFITDFLENYKVMQIDIPLNVELDSIKFFKKKISAYIRKTEKNDPVFSLFIKNIIFWFYVSLENFKIKTVLYFVFSLDILKSPHISVLKKLFSGYLNTLIHKVK